MLWLVRLLVFLSVALVATLALSMHAPQRSTSPAHSKALINARVGPEDLPRKYNCSAGGVTDTYFRCTVPAGVGGALRLQVVIGGVVSAQSTVRACC